MTDYIIEYGPYRFFPRSNSVEELIPEIPQILRKFSSLNGNRSDWNAIVLDSNGEVYEIVRQGSKLIGLRLMEFENENKTEYMGSLEKKVE